MFLFLGKDPFSNLQIWKNFILNFGSCVVCISLVNPSNISLLLLSALTSEKPDQQTNQQLEDLCIWAVGRGQHGLLQVEFRYWGMQAKIEQFIHNMALRNTMLRAHRWGFIRFVFSKNHLRVKMLSPGKLGCGKTSGTGWLWTISELSVTILLHVSNIITCIINIIVIIYRRLKTTSELLVSTSSTWIERIAIWV